MFSKITKLTWLIRVFGLTKVAMIYYCRPKVIHVDDDSLEIKIPNAKSSIAIIISSIIIFNKKISSKLANIVIINFF